MGNNLPVSSDDEKYFSVGGRLCAERERLGYEMQQLAAIGQVTRKTQYNYENNKSAPTSTYLDLVAEKGADVYFILTGRHATPALTAEQERAGYQVRILSPEEVRALEGLKAGGLLTADDLGGLDRRADVGVLRSGGGQPLVGRAKRAADKKKA